MTNEELIKALRNRRVCLQATGSLDDHGLLEEAAKAIESAVKSAQEAWKYASENMPKWIPVSEKLPKEYKFVLCFTDEHDMFLATYLGLDGDGEPIFDDYHGDYWEGSVTHWQYLPQPPKEVSE